MDKREIIERTCIWKFKYIISNVWMWKNSYGYDIWAKPLDFRAGDRENIRTRDLSPPNEIGPAREFIFPMAIFGHGSKFQFIATEWTSTSLMCVVCCEMIFVFTGLALVVFVYKVKKKKKKKSIKILPKMPRMAFEPTPCEFSCASLSPLSNGVIRSKPSVDFALL